MSSERSKKKNTQERPLEKCIINKVWQNGMAHISIIRRTSSKQWIIGGYLVDLYCLGLKDTFVHRNVTKLQVKIYCQNLLMEAEFVDCPIGLARQIVYGGIDYAKELGLSPHKDFKFTKKVLGERAPEEEIYDVEFGYEGKPFYISGPNDDVDLILRQLNISSSDCDAE